MEIQTLDALLIGLMETIAEKEVGFLFRKIHQDSWNDLSKEERKKVRLACKEAVDLIKSRVDYHLFDRYSVVSLD
jgi:hypothetical protein